MAERLNLYLLYKFNYLTTGGNVECEGLNKYLMLYEASKKSERLALFDKSDRMGL